MTLQSAKARPIRFELWLRVECQDKECANWTFIPSRERPPSMPCVVCGKKIPLAGLEKTGREWTRRGENGQDTKQG